VRHLLGDPRTRLWQAGPPALIFVAVALLWEKTASLQPLSHPSAIWTSLVAAHARLFDDVVATFW